MIEERNVSASETLFEQRFDLSVALTATITKNLKSGSILTKRDFVNASKAMVITELIERGNLIDTSNSELKQILLELNKTNFNLTMEVLAIEDGFIGDRIRVRNRESGEVIFATVKDVGLVEVR